MALYFYDGQIRRFLVQFARIFSDWEVTKGIDPNGNPVRVRIPIKYGDSSRQVETIIANNTASNLPSTPLLTFYISGIEYDQRRTQDPTFVDKRQIRQRQYNQETQTFDQLQGQAFTIERIMPVPYTLRISLDFWSSSNNQKLEFFEQLGTLFNPGLEIQSTDNFVDWTSLSVVFQDGLSWTSRSVPQGTGNAIDILSWKFYMPIWISMPMKVKKMGVVQKVIASVFQGNELTDMADEDLLLGTRQKITPHGYRVLFLGNTLQVLPANQPFNPSNSSLNPPASPNTSVYWSAVLNQYGAIRPGISQIWLQNPYMERDIIGTIVPDPNDDRILIYDVDRDTLPINTLLPIDAVVNPRVQGPNSGLPGPVNGIRYLVVEDIGETSVKLKILGTELGGTTPANDLTFTVTGIGTSGTITSIGEIGGRAVATPGIYGGYMGVPSINIKGPGNGAYFRVEKIGNGSTYTSLNTTLTVINGGSGYTTGDQTLSWGSVIANANDIIEYDAISNEWKVVFDSVEATTNNQIHYVTNLTTNIQYRFSEDMWQKSFEGWYNGGDWSVVI